MIPEVAVWLIFFLPLSSSVVISFGIRPFLNRYSIVAGYVAIVTIGSSFALSLWALKSVINNGLPNWPAHSWLSIGEIKVTIGILMDPLTAIMLVVVTSISFLVQVYSTGYMRGDPGYARYFAYMSLFTASMIGLVIAANIVQIYLFWELVGLCSYLLIGFWFKRPSAAAAAKKAFIVTRLGDFGFLIAILYIAYNAGSFVDGMNPLEVADINTAAKTGLLATGVVGWIALGIFAGAIGKSGQFPLHTWLPDAMEGPTPVSALIHAATMVAAGVFLVARFFDVFSASDLAMNVVALVGGFTAVFAASIGLVSNDIKRVLAYSTISQLGFMMLALGTGALGAAIFHLFAHAFFKALLFLGAGSASHATGTFDMRYMGGLRKAMPWTYATFLIGTLSLSGIFPLAGFWSKDEILAHAWVTDGTVSNLVFGLAIVAVFMTAFYMFRCLFMTFHGEFRGGGETDPDAVLHGPLHLSESPTVMVVPLAILGVASVLGGYFVNPMFNIGTLSSHWLTEFLGETSEGFNLPVAISSSTVAVAGIGIAFVMYQTKHLSPKRVGELLRPVYTLVSRKYYIDELYEWGITTRMLYGGLAKFLDWADKSVVDGVVRFIDHCGRNIGRGIAQLQTGQLQGYGMAMSIGTLTIFGIYILTN